MHAGNYVTDTQFQHGQIKMLDFAFSNFSIGYFGDFVPLCSLS